ncbi:hypothetical protein ABIA31_007542 [Catenulispora sp. MAP5-51]
MRGALGLECASIFAIFTSMAWNLTFAFYLDVPSGMIPLVWNGDDVLRRGGSSWRLVTGFYGQNVPYLGFGTHIGFWTSTGVTIGLSIVFFFVFRRKDWI